jgi:dipeptidyl aminopeptidase/acylaminoacyl peptidase
MISEMREREYPGSEITLERTLAPGANYRRYLASYRSDGLKIYALLTVPNGWPPAQGWPAIVFNHGYIPPKEYRTTERYVAYVDGFARNGYVVFRPDYRGHGNSEGEPSSAYTTPDYTVDVLNAYHSLRKYKGVNPSRIGMWGHSMGGNITLRAMVIDKTIKAGVIWAGAVAPYEDLVYNWRRRDGGQAQQRNPITAALNDSFYKAISPNSYLSEGMRPIQLHHGDADKVVPLEFSRTLARQLREAKQPYEFYAYKGNDHNLSQSFSLAMRRSVAFFDRYLKD